MVMSPEERRRRMHKALGHDGTGSRRERARRPETAENTVNHTAGSRSDTRSGGRNGIRAGIGTKYTENETANPKEIVIPDFQDTLEEQEEAAAAYHGTVEENAALTSEAGYRRRSDAVRSGERHRRRTDAGRSSERDRDWDRDREREWPGERERTEAESERPNERRREDSAERTGHRNGYSSEHDDGQGTERSIERSGRHGSERSGRQGGRRNGRDRDGGGVDVTKIALLVGALLVIILLIFGIKTVFGGLGKGKPAETTIAEETTVPESETEPVETEPARDYIGEATLMAAQYDYDGAIELLKSMPDYETNEAAKQLEAKCEETKATLVEVNLQEVTHVFFHILCVDPVNSFDSSKWGTQAGGYNSLMTTIDEFKKMMQEMYDKGYVLISMHDMVSFTENADGTTTAVKQKIMLPPGKKAFVMSEDDVCYYEYMVGAGYADKMIIGEDGRPTLHYTDKDGNEFVGDYDLVGVLDTFIDEHPDFSYKGHKACLVFTGYNGILGYRTDESYDPNSEYYDPKLEQGHDIEAERKEAIEVLKALIADGYDVGSHSWGHRDLGQIEFARFTKDCDRWERNVAPLIREATGKQPDIIIYPKGADVADWHGYSHSNERFDYMHKLGFRYFCNVDSSQYWVQIGDDYFRQGRRALDGYNMWNDMANGYTRLSDLFDNVSAIFDPARPTPVPPY